MLHNDIEKEKSEILRFAKELLDKCEDVSLLRMICLILIKG